MAHDTTAARPVRRLVARALWTVVGVVVAMLLYFICQGVFAGYPQYGTDVLTYIAVALIVVTAGAAWIIDQRRIDDDDH
jgi:uncharacterized membrane protein YccC